MIRIEFPSDNRALAQAIGRALFEYGGGGVVPLSPVSNTVVVKAGENLAAGDAVVATVEETPAEETIDEEQGGGIGSPLDDGPGLEEQIGETTATTAGTDTAGADDRIDEKDVPFNAVFCGKAAKPFYGSGKRLGQWKKRQGVADSDYDKWYAEELEAIKAMDTIAGEISTDKEPAVDTAAAFGGGQQTTQETADAWVPTDAGALMGWVTSKQGAGLLTAQDVINAYATAALVVTDLFHPVAPEVCVQNVAVIFSILVAKAGP